MSPSHSFLSGSVVIEGGDAFPHGVRRLRESFPDIDWRVHLRE
jgi:hypothetical protein